MKKLKALLFALIPLLLLALQDSSACAWYGCSSWHTAGCASPDATTGCRACTYDCDASNCCECGGGGSWQGMECPSGSSGSGSSVPTCSAESVSTNSGGQVRVETQTGYGTGEMVCQPSDCDSGMALVGTLSDVLGNNLNFHNYKVCVSGAAGGYTLACESDHTTEANICNPGSCDAGYVSIGDIHELHWEWARNYRICVQGIASGSIISCDSNANNNEADICNPGSCGANELLVGDVHELHNSIWRNYRVCVRPNTRVSGTLRYKGGGGVISSTTQTINTCITGVSPTVQPATSATQGSFYFDTGLYSGFCIRAPDMTGYTKTAVNKRGSDTTSYEWQKAGINCATAPSGSCNANQVNRDRATDSGYDFEYCLNDGGLGCSIAAGGSGTTNCCSSDAQCDVVVAGPTSRCIRCDANHRQTSPAVDYGGGLCKSACGASSYCNWAEPGYSYDYGTTPVCCKSDCSADTAKPSCSAVGTASGGSCYTAGQTTSCTTSGWSACSGGTTTSCSAGTASCSDSGAAVGGTCYWGESCSASGYTAPTSAVIDDGMACTVDACTSTGVTHTFDNTISGCGISFRCYYKSATEYNCKDCADQTNCQSTSGCLWCPAVASVDVTDSGNAPLTSGKCRDYSAPSAGSCAAPGACSSTDYSDACGTSNTDILTETYASAASCLTATYDCTTYGQTCSDTDGGVLPFTLGTVSGTDATGCNAFKCNQNTYSHPDACGSGANSNTLTEYGCPANPAGQDAPYTSTDVDCTTYGQTCADTDASAADHFKLAGSVSGSDSTGCSSGKCSQATYSLADACGTGASSYILTEYGCAASPSGQNTPYASSSKDCRDYDTAATGDSDDSPTTAGNCVNGDYSTCGTGQCSVDATRKAYAEGCYTSLAADSYGVNVPSGAVSCGAGTDSCNYIEYFGINANGGGLVERCVDKTYDADEYANACSSCGQVWVASGEGWWSGSAVSDQPGEYTALGQVKCCGDDSSEAAGVKRGVAADTTDKACCKTSSECVYNHQCYKDIDTLASDTGIGKQALRGSVYAGRAYQDVNGDGILDVCEAHSPGEWVSPSGSLSGTVTSVTGTPVQGAEVKVLGTPYKALTDAAGHYVITGVNSSKVYDMVASKAPFSPTLLKERSLPDYQSVVVDFVLGYGPNNCEEDCTLTSDEQCHSECGGTNGCVFYSQQAISACDGLHKGFIMPYTDPAHPAQKKEIECCKGQPYDYREVKAVTTISNATNVVRITRIVVFHGKLVRMVVDVFD